MRTIVAISWHLQLTEGVTFNANGRHTSNRRLQNCSTTCTANGLSRSESHARQHIIQFRLVQRTPTIRSCYRQEFHFKILSLGGAKSFHMTACVGTVRVVKGIGSSEVQFAISSIVTGVLAVSDHQTNSRERTHTHLNLHALT